MYMFLNIGQFLNDADRDAFNLADGDLSGEDSSNNWVDEIFDNDDNDDDSDEDYIPEEDESIVLDFEVQNLDGYYHSDVEDDDEDDIDYVTYPRK